jgi:cytochrome b
MFKAVTARKVDQVMRVWDLPLRLFHWGLMISVVGAVASSKVGAINVHERFGLTVMGLVLFRVIWGFFGGYHARFSHFVKAPQAVLAWLRSAKDEPVRAAGHSPIGAYAVLALLAIAGYMATTGSMSNDDILFDGPLAHLVPQYTKAISGLHHDGQLVLFALVVMHIGAIIYYKRVKKRGLTAAMVHGRATDAPGTITGPDGGITVPHMVAGLVLLAASIGVCHLLPLLRPGF